MTQMSLFGLVYVTHKKETQQKFSVATLCKLTLQSFQPLTFLWKTKVGHLAAQIVPSLSPRTYSQPTHDPKRSPR